MAVLLIGGTSGTGKSSLAKHLATRLNARVLDVDVYRASLTSQFLHDTMPGLNRKVDVGEAILDLPTGSQLDMKVRSAREVCKSLEDRIREHLSLETELVIEGDDVLPELTDRFAGADLRAVFILPRSEREIVRRETIREPVLTSSDPDRRRRRTQVTWSYAEWLRGEATRRSLSVLDAAKSAALIAQAERVLGLDRP